MPTRQPTEESLDTTQLLRVLTALRKGDFSARLPLDWTGGGGKIADALNDLMELHDKMAQEFVRVSHAVGKEGKITQRLALGNVGGSWETLVTSVNTLIEDLGRPSSEMARVIGAVADGNLSPRMALDVDGKPLEGQFLHTARIVNTMVDQLNSFASEVTRVAREVGTEGKLGGQAEVQGVAGTWKALTDSVNIMASNLTAQVRNIAEVTTAVATGDLSKKITVDVKGEILGLKNTINTMVDQLNSFASEVTRVAREVGVEGKLGGQASVPGAAGIWKDLTDNVNQLAANLTTQVRAIAEVATAVTKGDLTRSIRVEASGEVAVLTDNINEMIRNLRDTTQKNSEQDWLKTNLAKCTRLLPGQKDLLAVAKLILSELAPLVSAQHGVFYLMSHGQTEPRLRLLATYAYKERKGLSTEFALGEGLVGQCALEKERILITDVPSDYMQISSGLGHATPRNIIVLPVLFEGEVQAVIELASFQPFSPTSQAFLEQLTESIGIVLNTIEANTRTEELLKQSQELARELQSRQEQLQQTNQELQEKALLLAKQNAEVERKNHEVEQAKLEVEEKAAQLALTSKYKSEFLANMSHELRTPLNSLLLLARQLSTNPHGNLLPKQVEFAQAIHASGTELLLLINDILDLSKIESGIAALNMTTVPLADLCDGLERTFRPVADTKGVTFTIERDTPLPQYLHTDDLRLQQILKNLLSNAFKFTDQGQVTLQIFRATAGWSTDRDSLNTAETVIAFAVSDTGIGIPADKQRLIFEAFHQADGTTSRKYGGTGLGLSISREIAWLFGGELRLRSAVGKGSTFTFYLPQPALPASSWAPQQRGAMEKSKGHERMTQPPLPAGADPTPVPRTPSEPVLAGKKALIVDDDIRNLFALTSILEDQKMMILTAESGRTGIDLLQSTPDVDVVLMDIMMPEIDGYDTMRAIRSVRRLSRLPIIAVTAKAMPGDREKCLEAGASDYLAKPVETEQLLAHLCAAVAKP